MENPTKSTCSQVGLIACDKGTDACPAFFQVDATRSDDQISGVTVFIIGLVLLFICLFCMVYLLQKMLMGMSSRIIYKATNINGYLAILVGVGVTILVQSSSITTSVFTPLAGMDVIRLEQMFPITLGANIGTTVTALLAALLSSTEAMQVALAHLFFNISGILVWYPIPFMRNIPLNAARHLGKATRIWRGVPLAYIVVAFLLIPLTMLGLSLLFTQGSTGLTVLGSLITIFLFGGIIYFIYWFQFTGGKSRMGDCMVNRQSRREAINDLPSDMSMLKAKIKELEEHTGLLSEDTVADEKDVESPSQVEVDA
jgi:sodium-dependent phosphate cotransporter